VVRGVPEPSAAPLRLYPNPADDVLVAVLPSVHGAVTCTVLDATGRAVREELHMPAERMELAVAGLSPGHYLLLLNTNGTRYRAPFIKR
jgi:hypothetical protein